MGVRVLAVLPGFPIEEGACHDLSVFWKSRLLIVCGCARFGQGFISVAGKTDEILGTGTPPRRKWL
jgi:hypothetical protein